jgi:copper chaperone CopZ
MASPATRGKGLLCPSCGKNGKRVSAATLHALLKDPLGAGIASSEPSACRINGRGEPGGKPANGGTDWQFCDSLGCDVVYFAGNGDAAFTRPQLIVEVGVKETAGERPLCYCFGHSVATIKQELQAKGRSGALEDIRRKMNAAGCRCQTTNPSGSCCLGSVARGIEIARQELGMGEARHRKERLVATMNDSAGSRGEMIAKIGTVISALAASSCCWLPLVLLAVGISGVGIAATMEAFRPLFIVVTFGFLTAAFYYSYRPRKLAADDGIASGASESQGKTAPCCTPPRSRRFRMMTLNNVMLWVVTAFAAAFLLFPSYVGLLLSTGSGTAVPDGMNRAIVKIEGMSCEGCAAVAETAIREVPEVLAVKVSFEKGEAVLEAQPCCPMPYDAILKALHAAGFKGTFMGVAKDEASENRETEFKSRAAASPDAVPQ